MGWNQTNGKLKDWPEAATAPLYRTILGVNPKKDYKLEHVLNEQTGNKLYDDGTEASVPYDLKKDFMMQLVKYCKWDVQTGAYYSYDEMEQFVSMGKPPREVEVFSFSEKQSEMLVLAGNPLEAFYNHPMLTALIPADWVADV